MKQKEIILGIDVSKANLDICMLKDGQSHFSQVKNNVKSIKAFFAKISKQNKDSELVVCMENTGYYNWPCYEAFQDMPVELFVVNPLHLKKSMGLVRGKTDVIDSN